MFDVVGYCRIKHNATTGISPENINSFLGKAFRVMEFAEDGGVMIINSEATGLATFDKCDVVAKFECGQSGIYVLPPKLHALEQMAYVGRCMNRKGRYNQLVRAMVVEASLFKGTFTDSFLWEKQ